MAAKYAVCLVTTACRRARGDGNASEGTIRLIGESGRYVRVNEFSLHCGRFRKIAVENIDLIVVQVGRIEVRGATDGAERDSLVHRMIGAVHQSAAARGNRERSNHADAN
ncbi:MAG: hypothetical protein WA807_09340 [Steroidobacteraceae bacterium]